MTYDPVTGEGYTQAEAAAAWNASMARTRYEGPHWKLRMLARNQAAGPSRAVWTYFNFQPYTGRVTAEPDGFHWATYSYDTGELIHEGVTASVYETYQSIVQNKPVQHGNIMITGQEG